MKRFLIITCILSIAAISPVFAKNTTDYTYKIASSGYGSSSGGGYGSSGGGYNGSGSGYNNSSGYNSNNGSLSTDAQRLQQWLDANPAQAQQLQQAIRNSADPAQALKQWLESHPEQAAQIKGLF